jgi:hypothetical protein
MVLNENVATSLPVCSAVQSTDSRQRKKVGQQTRNPEASRPTLPDLERRLVSRWSRTGAILLLPVLASTSSAQAAAAPEAPHQPTHSENSPNPAGVAFHEGKLTVTANNSQLTQILQAISQQSGMVIEGAVADTRVYGIYGPQSPPAVLTDLLNGLGYNILMVGASPQGAPRKLVLTRRTGTASPPQPVTPAIATNRAAPPGPLPADRPPEPTLGPGAIAHPPPDPPSDPDTRVQQQLQRLHQMHVPQNESAPH